MPVSAFAVLTTFLPLPLVTVALRTLPCPLTVLFALPPTTLIELSVIPLEPTFSISLSSLIEPTSVNTIVGQLRSFSFFIFIEVALKDPIFGDHDSETLAMATVVLSEIDAGVVADDFEGFFLEEHFETETWVGWSVRFYECFVLFLGWNAKFCAGIFD